MEEAVISTNEMSQSIVRHEVSKQSFIITNSVESMIAIVMDIGGTKIKLGLVTRVMNYYVQQALMRNQQMG